MGYGNLKIKIILAFLGGLVFLDFSFAATLILNTGERIEGEIVKKTSRYVQIKGPFGLSIYFADAIKEIIPDPSSQTSELKSLPLSTPEIAEDRKEDFSLPNETINLEEMDLSSSFDREIVVKEKEDSIPLPPSMDGSFYLTPPKKSLEVSGVELDTEESTNINKEQKKRPNYGPRETVIISYDGRLLQESELPQHDSWFEIQ